MSTEERIFVRKASGIVKIADPKHMLIFNIITPAFFSGMWIAFAFNPVLFPSSNFLLGLLLLAIFATFPYLVFTMLTASFPRTGSDYVYVSRIIHPAAGFTSSLNSWVIWQWWYNTFFGYTATAIYLAPLFSRLGTLTDSESFTGASSWLLSPTGLAVVTYLIMIIAGLIIGLGGMKNFLKVQWVLVTLAFLGVVAMYLIFATNSHEIFVKNLNTNLAPLTGANDTYNSIIQKAALAPAPSSAQAILHDSVGTWIIPWTYSLGWAFFGILWVGEMKGAEAFRNQVKTIIIPFYINIAIWAVAWIGLINMVGLNFLSSVSVLSFSADPLVSHFPGGLSYFPSIVAAGTDNPLLLTVFMVGAAVNSMGIVFSIYVGVTRVLFAQAFDRVWPERIAHIDRRTRTPLVAMLVNIVASLIWMAFALAYPNILIYFVSVAVAISISWIITMLAGILFPLRRKQLFESSPIVKYKVGRVSLISIFGIIGILFNLILIYYMLSIPALGFVNSISVSIIAGLFIACAGYWFIASWYRRRQGIDIEMAYRVVPPA